MDHGRSMGASLRQVAPCATIPPLCAAPGPPACDRRRSSADGMHVRLVDRPSARRPHRRVTRSRARSTRPSRCMASESLSVFTAVQRFRSHLGLYVHLHCLITDDLDLDPALAPCIRSSITPAWRARTSISTIVSIFPPRLHPLRPPARDDLLPAQDRSTGPPHVQVGGPGAARRVGVSTGSLGTHTRRGSRPRCMAIRRSASATRRGVRPNAQCGCRCAR